MEPDEIKVNHCYSMAPVRGRRTIARVTELFKMTAMAAYEHIRRGGTENPRDEPYHGAVCMAARLLLDGMVEKSEGAADR
jgi:hypothetical protein